MSPASLSLVLLGRTDGASLIFIEHPQDETRSSLVKLKAQPPETHGKTALLHAKQSISSRLTRLYLSRISPVVQLPATPRKARSFSNPPTGKAPNAAHSNYRSDRRRHSKQRLSFCRPCQLRVSSVVCRLSPVDPISPALSPNPRSPTVLRLAADMRNQDLHSEVEVTARP